MLSAQAESADSTLACWRRAGHDVALLARGEHLRAIRAAGLEIRSAEFGTFVVNGVASDDPADLGQADMVLFTVKTYDLELAARAAKRGLAPKGSLVTFQNGLDAPDQVAAIVGKERVLIGTTALESQATLEVAVRPTREAWQVANDEIAFGGLVERVRRLKPSLIVLEATGGIHLPVFAALAAAKLPVVAVNPRQARDFAKATGKLAKTDRIDARVLAHFAEAVRPEVRTLPDAATQELAILVARRRQLMEMRAAEPNRSCGTPTRIRSQIREHLDWLNRQIDELDREIGHRLRSSPAWRERDDLYRSAPGVAPVLSATLLADLPELGTVPNKQLAALVGLAPFNQDSSRKRGKRVIWGGRASVLRCTWPPWLSPGAIRSFGRLSAPSRHAQTQEGALTACMHKLLTILNAMARLPTSWLCPYTSRCLTTKTVAKSFVVKPVAAGLIVTVNDTRT